MAGQVLLRPLHKHACPAKVDLPGQLCRQHVLAFGIADMTQTDMVFRAHSDIGIVTVDALLGLPSLHVYRSAKTSQDQASGGEQLRTTELLPHC